MSGQLAEAVRVLRKIGVDDIAGYYDVDEVEASGTQSETYESLSPDELSDRIVAGEAMLVDVRSRAEWRAGHVPATHHMFLGMLSDEAAELPTDKIGSAVNFVQRQVNG